MGAQAASCFAGLREKLARETIQTGSSPRTWEPVVEGAATLRLLSNDLRSTTRSCLAMARTVRVTWSGVDRVPSLAWERSATTTCGPRGHCWPGARYPIHPALRTWPPQTESSYKSRLARRLRPPGNRRPQPLTLRRTGRASIEASGHSQRNRFGTGSEMRGQSRRDLELCDRLDAMKAAGPPLVAAVTLA